LIRSRPSVRAPGNSPPARTLFEAENAFWRAWGQACYESYGDRLRVLDRKADGKWVKAVAETSSGKLLVCEDHSSEGGWLDCDNNISEREKVRVRAELRDGGDFVTATGWSRWVHA
jgi:hypothetical protein